MNISYIKTFLLLLIGGFIHFFSDLLSNKKIHLLYPFNKKGYSLGLINYFDPYPSLIFILFNFVLTLKLNNINYLIYYIPMVFMAFYISLKYIMKNKLKNSYKTIPCGGELIIVPTFYITIWQIMVVKKNTILIINRTPFKENYLSIRFLENNYKGEYQENLKKSNNYKNFISNFPLTYSQEIERMGKKYYQVFDINNFFSLFKKEQCYYEAEVNGRDIIKEKIVI